MDGAMVMYVGRRALETAMLLAAPVQAEEKKKDMSGNMNPY